jgi:hypothetical protein
VKPATRLAVVALLGLSGASAFAQASFKPPSYIPPFKDAGSLLPGGRQMFGEALAERMKDSADRAADAMARSSCATPPQIRIPGSSGVCTDYALGNVSLARYSANFAPIVVIVKKEGP